MRRFKRKSNVFCFRLFRSFSLSTSSFLSSSHSFLIGSGHHFQFHPCHLLCSRAIDFEKRQNFVTKLVVSVHSLGYTRRRLHGSAHFMNIVSLRHAVYACTIFIFTNN